MATKLPSSGSVPEGRTPGCDTSGLILVHRIFRWLYSQLPMLIREVDAGDLKRAAIVGDYAKLDFFALHLHHETEDTVLWDRLTTRDPTCVAHVDQMRAQHAEVASQLARIVCSASPQRAFAPAGAATISAGILDSRATSSAHIA